MPSERAMRLAKHLVRELEIPSVTLHLAEALDAERHAGMEAAAEILDAHLDGKASAKFIRAAIAKEKAGKG